MNENDDRTEAGLPMRKALLRLRIVEHAIGPGLAAWERRGLAAAIDGVVELIRKSEDSK